MVSTYIYILSLTRCNPQFKDVVVTCDKLDLFITVLASYS